MIGQKMKLWQKLKLNARRNFRIIGKQKLPNPTPKEQMENDRSSFVLISTFILLGQALREAGYITQISGGYRVIFHNWIELSIWIVASISLSTAFIHISKYLIKEEQYEKKKVVTKDNSD